MKNLTIPLALIAAATLAACASNRDAVTVIGTATLAPTETTVNAAPRPGYGKVIVLVDPTGPVNAVTTQFMTLRMEDGSMQTIAQRGHQVANGERVLIRSDGSVSREALAQN